MDYLSCSFFFFSSRRRHTRFSRDWSSDVCSSDLVPVLGRRRVHQRPGHRHQRWDGLTGPGRRFTLQCRRRGDTRGIRPRRTEETLMKMQAAMVLCMALLAGGCASTSTVMLGPARPAISPEQVQVYYTPPPGRYDEIAVLETSSGGFTYGEQNKMNAVIGKLRTAAAELGANGVLFQGTAEGYGGSSIGIGVGGG